MDIESHLSSIFVFCTYGGETRDSGNEVRYGIILGRSGSKCSSSVETNAGYFVAHSGYEKVKERERRKTNIEGAED